GGKPNPVPAAGPRKGYAEESGFSRSTVLRTHAGLRKAGMMKRLRRRGAMLIWFPPLADMTPAEARDRLARMRRLQERRKNRAKQEVSNLPPHPAPIADEVSHLRPVQVAHSPPEEVANPAPLNHQIITPKIYRRADRSRSPITEQAI